MTIGGPRAGDLARFDPAGFDPARFDPSVYLVTDAAQARRAGHDPVAAVVAAVAGGVTAVQVREKRAEARDILAFAEALAQRLPERVALLVNDRTDVFLAARARGARVTGVHIGQDDLPAETVRQLIGPDAVLGLTAQTPQQLAAAAASPARVDYVGVGTVHATRSKPDAPPPLGVAGFAARVRDCPLPAVAIGGIGVADVAPLRRAGAAGVAVVSHICGASDPHRAAQQLAQEWRTSRE